VRICDPQPAKVSLVRAFTAFSGVRRHGKSCTVVWPVTICATCPVTFFFEELEVDAAIKALKDQGFEPDFNVIDTLARSMSGGNENDTGDMSVAGK
jgi:hypothetical protein